MQKASKSRQTSLNKFSGLATGNDCADGGSKKEKCDIYLYATAALDGPARGIISTRLNPASLPLFQNQHR